MDTMFVKPAEGVRCKDPLTFEVMPAEGRNVPRTGYWLKRLKKGEVVMAEKGVPKAAKVESKSTYFNTDSEGDS